MLSDYSVIIENTAERPIIDAIQGLIADADHVRLAVGYLFIEGLAPLIESIGAVERIDLLIGNVVNRLTDEQLRESGVLPVAPGADDNEEFVADYRDARNRAATETALNLRRTIEILPQTTENRRILMEMARWIWEGRLKVRLNTQHRLHAKVTLAAYPEGHANAPGRAIVGSSNFTMPGALALAAAPSNLDVLIDGEANFNQLSRWFEWHWTEAQDFQRELFEELGRSWALTQS